jgi:phospholipid-translocating ATPase
LVSYLFTDIDLCLGDKLQTAIEIGYSCNLLKKDMDVMILSCDTPESTRSHIEAGLNKIASVLGTYDFSPRISSPRFPAHLTPTHPPGPPNLDPKNRGFMPNAKASFAVVIDGDTLRYALGEEYGLKGLFLTLATQCETVVCCRVSPAQKALTVKLVGCPFFFSPGCIP